MVSEDGTRGQKNWRQIDPWVEPIRKSSGGNFFIFCLHPNRYIRTPLLRKNVQNKMVLVTHLVSNQALIVPASQGLTVVMDCKENYIRFEYACLPAKFDVGDLKCTMKSVRERKPYRRYTLGIAGFFSPQVLLNSRL